VLLVIKVNALLLDTLKLVVLCMKHVHISYDTGISKMVEHVVDDKMTGTAGVEDDVVGVLDTGMIEVGGGECTCVKKGPIDSLVLALCPLMDYSIVDIEVVDVLGSSWSMVGVDEDKWVVTGIGGVKVHPLTTWVVSILCLLGLGGDMGDFRQSGKTVKEGGWRSVNQLIFIFHVGVDDVSEDGDKAEVGEVIEDIVSDKDGVC